MQKRFEGITTPALPLLGIYGYGAAEGIIALFKGCRAISKYAVHIVQECKSFSVYILYHLISVGASCLHQREIRFSFSANMLIQSYVTNGVCRLEFNPSKSNIAWPAPDPQAIQNFDIRINLTALNQHQRQQMESSITAMNQCMEGKPSRTRPSPKEVLQNTIRLHPGVFRPIPHFRSPHAIAESNRLRNSGIRLCR